jgi:hypothetical protein
MIYEDVYIGSCRSCPRREYQKCKEANRKLHRYHLGSIPGWCPLEEV